MKIGLNLLYMIPQTVGGTETYATGLLRGLSAIDGENEYVVFVNRESATWPLPVAANFTRVVCPVFGQSRVRRYLFEQARLPVLLRRHGIDVVHSLGYVAPLLPPCPSVVTIHDLNFAEFGSHMPWARRWALRVFVTQSARRAKRVITVSQFSRDHILATLGISERKVTVILEAATKISPLRTDGTSTLEAHGIVDPYIIAFSSSSPNKNIHRLVEAFVEARKQYGLPHMLVLIGHVPYDAGQLGETDGVVYSGYVDESSKHALLAMAEMLVFPSTYEGFGLPVLEAQQLGVPVLCSTAGSLPEVAGDAALFFSPLSVSEMTEAIGRMAGSSELRCALKERGLHNVQRFSWEQTARETLQVYESVA